MLLVDLGYGYMGVFFEILLISLYDYLLTYDLYIFSIYVILEFKSSPKNSNPEKDRQIDR